MREKLFVYTRRLEERGISSRIFSWSDPLDPYENFITVDKSVFARVTMKAVPQKHRVKFIEYLTYRAAYVHAAKHGLPILGLTSSSPWGLLAAKMMIHLRKPYVQRILYIGLHTEGGTESVRKSIMAAYQLALGKTGIAIFNTPFPEEKFRLHQPLRSLRRTPSVLVHEPIFHPGTTSSGRSRGNVLLTFGPETFQRTPLRHLTEARLAGLFSKIVIHNPGKEKVDAPTIAKVETSLGCEVQRHDAFVENAEFTKLFDQANYCLIAYDPSFNASSSLLMQSIICGLPVLTSNFPDSAYVRQSLGKIGEFFDYLDFSSFEKAVHRLVAWNDDDWNEFGRAQAQAIQDNGYDRIVDQCVSLLGLDRSRGAGPTRA